MRALVLIMGLGLSACAATAPVKDTALKPYKIAAGEDALAQRATPSRERVADTYHWVHTHEYSEIEARLRAEIPNNTRRLYNPKDGVRVKYIGREDVYYWSAASQQLRRGTWDIRQGQFGPQICETFYGETACLNTVEQLSGVGVIDSRKGDAFGLEQGMRPIIGKDGLPDWG